MIIAISSILLFVSCNAQKKVMEPHSANANLPVYYNDSLQSSYDEAYKLSKVSIDNIDELRAKTYHINDLPYEDEKLFHSIRRTARSMQIQEEMKATGELERHVHTLIDALSEQHRLNMMEQNIIGMRFTYLVSLSNVLQKKLIEVQIINLSPELDSKEAKAIFEFAKSMPIEFEYQQYKDYTTGYLAVSVPFRIQVKKSQ